MYHLNKLCFAVSTVLAFFLFSGSVSADAETKTKTETKKEIETETETETKTETEAETESETETISENKPIKKLEKIKVTGSHISRIDIEGPTPVITISRDDMQKRGFQTVYDAVVNLTENKGGMTQNNSNSFTSGAQAINLRGMGSARTLVLINGQRMPIYPIGIGGTTNFVDIGQIPTMAVERIEVLSTGGSSVYGSDGIGGVVNVILKKDFQGNQFTFYSYGTQYGGGERNKASFVAGKSFDNGRLFATFQIESKQPLYTTNRPAINNDVNPKVELPTYYSRYGAYFRTIKPDPKNPKQKILDQLFSPPSGCEAFLGKSAAVLKDGRCGYNYLYKHLLHAQTDRKDIFVYGDYNLNDTTTLTSYFIYGDKDVIYHSKPKGYDLKLSDTDIGNPTVDTTRPQEGAWYRRLFELKNQKMIKEQHYGFNVGVNGVLKDVYDWNIAIYYARQNIERYTDAYLRDTLKEMVKNKEVNLLERLSDEAINKIQRQSFQNGWSSLMGASMSLSGEVFELPSGMLSFATLAEFNRSEYFITADKETISGDYGIQPSLGEGLRDQFGLGGELLVPVLSKVNVSLSARYDAYKDKSQDKSAITYGTFLEYRPTDRLLIRGGRESNFRAPSLQRVFGKDGNGYGSIYDSVYCRDENSTDKQTVCRSQSYLVTNQSNIALGAETSENRSLGLVWEPIDDLSLTVHWSDILLKDKVAVPSRRSVLSDAGKDTNPVDGFDNKGNAIKIYSSKKYEGAKVLRDAKTGKLLDEDTSGRTPTLTRRPVNMSKKRHSEVDVKLKYTFPETSLGQFSFTVSASYILNNAGQFSAASSEYSDLEYDRRLYANFNIGWEYKKLTMNLFTRYGGSFCSTESENEGKPFDTCENAKLAGYNPEIPASTLFNLSFAYRLTENIKLSGGLNDLLNQGPIIDSISTSKPYIGAGSAKGRAFYARLTIDF